MILNRDSILSAVDLKREIVPVPEWGPGAEVIVGEMSALDRMRFATMSKDSQQAEKHFIGWALTWFIIDNDGNKVFQPEDADLLAGKSLDVLSRLFEVAKRLNAMGEAAESDVKNSEPSQSGFLPSDSL